MRNTNSSFGLDNPNKMDFRPLRFCGLDCSLTDTEEEEDEEFDMLSSVFTKYYLFV